MALILNIDTATDYASIALAVNGKLVHLMKNPSLRDHASWLHKAIHELMLKCGYSLNQLEAVAVTAGPGSYTGLRIGMASAKGLCYVLNIPLLTESTLKVMANAFIESTAFTPEPATHAVHPREIENWKRETLLVPMIDARRMEVFTAVYDFNLKERMPPLALVLDSESFSGIKAGERLICFGNGSAKFEKLVRPGEFEFSESSYDAGALLSLAYEKFQKGEFADLAYTEPLYLKEFHSTIKK